MKKILLLALIIRLVFIFGGYHPDLGNHVDWGIKFWEYGPSSFYEQSVWGVSWPNQPPGTVYLWATLAKLKEIFWGLLWWININIRLFPSNLMFFLETRLHPAMVKLPAIFSEIGIGWLIYLIVKRLKKEKMAKLASMIFLFNPITIYNSAIWGQTDGVISFFGLLAIYLFLVKKPFWVMFPFLISLYFKASLIILAPIILILLFKEKLRYDKLLASVLLPILVILLLSLPFVFNKNVFTWFFDLYLNKIFSRQGNMLTANAFNLWALLFGIDFTRTDQGQFLVFNFRQWGQGLFLILNLPVMLVLILRKTKWQKIFFALTLVSFSSFLFLTNMHERYLYLAFPYLSILVGFYPGFVWLFGTISIIHLLNLYNLWYYPRIEFLVGMLDWRGAALVRFLSLILLAFYAYFFFVFLRNLKNDRIRAR